MFQVQIAKQLGQFRLDVQFASVGDGGVTALFGASGSGKTSVIRCVAGLARPDSGRVVVNDRVLFDSAARINLPVHRRRLGYIFQESRLFPHLSVHRNLVYGTPDSGAVVKFDAVVEVLGIDHLLDRRPAALSGGEKQRVAIGRALLTSPSLLLMDEPLASLDEARKREVLPFLAKLPAQFNIPILFVSHSMTEILQLADTLVLIEGGQVRDVGALEDVITRGDAGVLAGSVLATHVTGHEPEYGLTRLGIGAHELRVGALDLPVGTAVRVKIDPSEVILAREAPNGLSVQNVLPVTVRRIDTEDARALVRLDLDGSLLTASVTRRAADALALEPGQRLFALVKALSIARSRVVAHG
ncbi:MAG: molybdate transport system ATP-binding protein [Myxococcota bacterium]